MCNEEHKQRLERVAECWRKLLPGATVSRTRGCVQIDYDEERGIVLLITPEAVEVRLPTTVWVQPYAPIPSSRLWRRVELAELDETELPALIEEALAARAAEFVACRYCKKQFPPEHRHGDVCHGCAERHERIVH